MKLSQFTVIRDLSERNLENYYLVFNTLTSKSLVVKKDDWTEIIESLTDSKIARNPIQRATTKLREIGMIVPKSQNERINYQTRFDATRYGQNKLFPILAVTTACNIGCTYCYEEGINGTTMSSEVVDATIRWFKSRIIEDGVTGIYPSLFGGEPLLYPKVLYRIMDGLNETCKKHNVDIYYSSSSNGVLLTDQIAMKLASRGLRQIQISLDGPPELHNLRRIGKRGQPSYEESLLGIRNAVKHVDSVTVKINFDRQNLNSINKLYHLLFEYGLHKRINVKLEAIAHQMPGSSVVHNANFVIPPDSEELANAYTKLILEAKELGIVVTRDTAHTTPCMFSSNHGVLIDPEGEIYKCISLVGRPEFKVGDVFKGYKQKVYNDQMNVYKRTSECFEEKCQYIPVCAGGCAYESIVRTGNYDLRYCTKTQLKKYHYQQQLIKHENQLVKLGMSPYTADELQTSVSGVKKSSLSGWLKVEYSIEEKSHH